jgi:hypothetical protein
MLKWRQAIAGHNLSLLMRHPIGATTPQGAVAGRYGGFCLPSVFGRAVLIAQIVVIVSNEGDEAFVALWFAKG